MVHLVGTLLSYQLHEETPMHPYLSEVLAQMHRDDLRRNAARHRLASLVKETQRRSGRRVLVARRPHRHLVERPCVDC